MKPLLPLFVMVALGCQSFRDPPVDGSGQSDVLTVDTTQLPGYLLCRESVKDFYTSRDNSLFWSDGVRTKPFVDSLLFLIRSAELSGLHPDDYHLREIDRLLADTLSANRLVRLDVLFSDAYFSLTAHIGRGRLDPGTLLTRDLSARVDEGAMASLQSIHGGHSLNHIFGKLEPQIGQYRDLKQLLKGFVLLAGADSAQAARATKIALNMERWRWQTKIPERYVSVNIPAFLMRVYERDSLWLETKVIVGKRETPTPVMESIINSFTIYPYWHVPKSISTKEILPSLQRDATYLRRNNFDVLDRNGAVILSDTIQWDYYTPDYFPFVLRQREGSENSMGIIKFNFANNYGVYLHDTNSKRLYERANRDLSHGCVRVSQAVSFAHYLVREDDIYVSPEDLDQYLSLQQRLKIDLRKPIVLKLEYFTAEVQNGVPYFYDDIYKKDSVMMQVLYSSPRTKDSIAGL